MKPITVIGIDPGASGALCFTSSEKKICIHINAIHQLLVEE